LNKHDTAKWVEQKGAAGACWLLNVDEDGANETEEGEGGEEGRKEGGVGEATAAGATGAAVAGAARECICRLGRVGWLLLVLGREQEEGRT